MWKEVLENFILRTPKGVQTNWKAIGDERSGDLGSTWTVDMAGNGQEGRNGGMDGRNTEWNGG